VKQVLLNLFKNSFEAMPDGGVVNISTEIVSRDGTPSLRLLFRDSGQGVQFENPNDVFLPFSSTKKDGANLGLGLSIVFSLIRKYDGDISVRNLPEGGCEFTILLPRQGRVPQA
jgi:C4-dicarboxylate-specific signal transduction histidine kinase